MNSVLGIGGAPIASKAFFAIAGGIAVGSAVIAFALVAIYHPYLGDVVGLGLWPFLVAMIVWLIAGVSRLRIVGFLPSKADHLIPTGLRPWIRFWLLVRVGLFGGWTLLIVAIVGAAIWGSPLRYLVEALVYLVWLRLFLDLCFGSAFNIGIIFGRHNVP